MPVRLSLSKVPLRAIHKPKKHNKANKTATWAIILFSSLTPLEQSNNKIAITNGIKAVGENEASIAPQVLIMIIKIDPKIVVLYAFIIMFLIITNKQNLFNKILVISQL